MNNILNKLNLGKKELYKCMIVVSIFMSAFMYHNMEMQELKSSYDTKIMSLEVSNKKNTDDAITYKVMFESLDNNLRVLQQERDEAVQKYDYIQEQIKYSYLNDKTKISRGGYENHNLKEYPVITIDKMNEFINKLAPKDSPFIGRGEEFLKMSAVTGVDPRYYFAHAAVESGYGRSSMALSKGNYFGINAQNANPNKAYDMGDDMEEGLYNGGSWIADNYIDKGRNTLNKMANFGYAQYDDGSPNTNWISQISNIASRF